MFKTFRPDGKSDVVCADYRRCVGKKIFEGDIIQFCTGMKLRYIVEFDFGGFMISRYDKCDEITNVYNCPCEVIGNIHDDPELLKEGDDT